MADKRDDEQKKDEPKIRVVDRRMLSDDERAGKGEPSEAGADEEEVERPRLEMVGGGSAKSAAVEPAQGTSAGGEGDAPGEEEELSEEEREKMRTEIENEQFAELEKQMGRPLTGQEKDQVRQEMTKQAEAVSRLEVAPLLVQLMAEMSARAAVHLGLMPNPYTRLVARNDAQARLAIDAYSAVYEVVKTQLDDNSRREFERVLNDLRVNFSSITGGSTGFTPGGGNMPGSGPRIIH